MRNRTVILLVALAALAAATVARAAGVSVSATVNAGTTLSVASLNTPLFNLTLNGDDQVATYQAQLQVIDARGLATGGGWNLTVTSTQYGDGSGHTLPAGASSISSIASSCHAATSTCQAISNTVPNTGLALPISPTTTKILNAASDSGLGRIDVNVNVNVAVPANTIAATYTSTVTFAISSGP